MKLQKRGRLKNVVKIYKLNLIIWKWKMIEWKIEDTIWWGEGDKDIRQLLRRGRDNVVG